MNNFAPVEFKNQRILTTEQLAEVYETTKKNVSNNFNNNIEHFEKNKHYFLLQGDELKSFLQSYNLGIQNPSKVRQLYLWTERGANRHCKILDTDKAWEQFDNLEETYFKVKEFKQDSYMIADPIERAKVWIKEQEEKKALQFDNQQKDKQLQEQHPKVIFAESVQAAQTSILVGDLAKIIKQNGHDIGGNRLFKWMRDKGYLIKRKGTDYNMPTQKAMDLGLFEIKETSISHSDGHISISKTPKVTGKGQIYFVNKFKEVV